MELHPLPAGLVAEVVVLVAAAVAAVACHLLGLIHRLTSVYKGCLWQQSVWKRNGSVLDHLVGNR